MKKKPTLWVLSIINIILVRIAIRTDNTIDDDIVSGIDEIIKKIKIGIDNNSILKLKK